MDTVRNRLIPLDEVPANRRLVEEIFANQGVSDNARDFAIDLLYPARAWGLWISRLLLALGVALVLCGVVYFYAFNWAAITDAVKLASVEFALAGCLGGSLYYGLDRLSGKMLALCAAALTGVFLAVFGQIYQTGADAWTLFAAWAALIIPWTAVANFAPLCGLWLIVANVGLALFWDQAALPTRDMELLIFPLLALFNCGVLGARECLEGRRPWLQPRWTRNLPAVIVLVCATLPCLWQIEDWGRATSAVTYGALAGIIILASFFYVYRYRKPDMQALAATVLAGCVILEFAVFKLLNGELYDSHNDVINLLVQAIFTIGLFGGAAVWLRLITKRVEARRG